MSETSEILMSILREKFNVTMALSPEMKLADIGIDSLDVINFLYSAEEATGVKIPDEAIVTDNLERIGDFTAYIDARRK